MIFEDEIKRLTRQLYPTGRAFKMPFDGVLDRINIALAKSESQALEDARSILNAILPDNADFTAADATQWERRLGIITGVGVSLADRKAAIIRKMNHPGDIPARQHYLYIERSLQLAGFNVWVHENIPEITPEDYITTGPTAVAQYGDFEYGELEYGDITESLTSPIEYGEPLEYGMAQYGGNYNNQVANFIDAALDLYFDHGANFRSSFFIGGQTFGTYADVDAAREAEFRQLILQLKPVNTISYIYINYV